jgi:hypothetical protein
VRAEENLVGSTPAEIRTACIPSTNDKTRSVCKATLYFCCYSRCKFRVRGLCNEVVFTISNEKENPELSLRDNTAMKFCLGQLIYFLIPGGGWEFFS